MYLNQLDLERREYNGFRPAGFRKSVRDTFGLYKLK